MYSVKEQNMGQRGMEKGMFLRSLHENSAQKQVVVCIVADGRLKINPRTRSVLAALGVYQEGVGKNVVNGKPVVRISIPCGFVLKAKTAHLYEYTTQCESDIYMHRNLLMQSGHLQ